MSAGQSQGCYYPLDSGPAHTTTRGEGADPSGRLAAADKQQAACHPSHRTKHAQAIRWPRPSLYVGVRSRRVVTYTAPAPSSRSITSPVGQTGPPTTPSGTS
jgi:hypothetical protein